MEGETLQQMVERERFERWQKARTDCPLTDPTTKRLRSWMWAEGIPEALFEPLAALLLHGEFVVEDGVMGEEAPAHAEGRARRLELAAEEIYWQVNGLARPDGEG